VDSGKSIIELARQAGFHKWYTQPKEHPDHVAIVARFAALVRAAALDEAAGVCDAQGQGRKALEHYASLTYAGAAHDCAAAIRALKEKT
jgi:hypothetical protein